SRRTQVSSTPHASGVTKPSPVMTTRRIPLIGVETNARVKNATGSALSLVDEFDGVPHRHNRFRSIVGNLDSELFFECHHKLDGIETVGAEIFDEAGVVGHLLGVHIQVLNHDLLHALRNVAHLLSASSSDTSLFYHGCLAMRTMPVRAPSPG